MVFRDWGRALFSFNFFCNWHYCRFLPSCPGLPPSPRPSAPPSPAPWPSPHYGLWRESILRILSHCVSPSVLGKYYWKFSQNTISFPICLEIIIYWGDMSPVEEGFGKWYICFSLLILGAYFSDSPNKKHVLKKWLLYVLSNYLKKKILCHGRGFISSGIMDEFKQIYTFCNSIF